MSGYRLVFPILVAAVILAGCEDNVVDNTMTDPPDGPISFQEYVLPIFTSSCGGIGCHIGMSTNGVELTNYEQVISSEGLQYGGPIVIPGDAGASPIIDKIGPTPEFGVRMPNGRAPLSATEIDIIRMWIDEGANDN